MAAPRSTAPRPLAAQGGRPRQLIVVLVALLAGLAVLPPPAQAAPPLCRCAFDFEDGTTQSWRVESGSGLSVYNTKTAFTGRRSLGITVNRPGAIDVEDSARLVGLTNTTIVTFHVYVPRADVLAVQPFAKDRSLVTHPTATVTLSRGWNTITRSVPPQSGVGAIGLALTPLRGWAGKINVDAVGWADSFVRRSGTHLQVQGQPYRFDGVNIYNANSLDDRCWYSMGDNGLLDQSLSALPGLEVFRSWFFQSLATRNGVRDWSAFDHTLQVAAAHHVKVVVTLANQWGDCEPTGYKGLSWYQGGYAQAQAGELASYRAWVLEVVTRYRNDATVAMWQLMNEAEGSDYLGGPCQEGAAATALRAFTDDVGGLAHQADGVHLVDLGTLGTGQCGTANSSYELVHASPGTDLCEYHDYGSPTSPMPGDQWNGLQVRLDQCNAHLGKPLFSGETGIHVPNEAADASQRSGELDAKLTAQYSANVVGVLMWAWNANCSTSCTSYDIGAGDPAVGLLTKY